MTLKLLRLGGWRRTAMLCASCVVLPFTGVMASAASAADAADAATAPGTLGRITAVEQGIETTAASVSLPAAGTGSLLVTPCTGCTPLSLAAGAQSAWLLGSKSSRYAEFRAAVVAAPRAQVLIIYRSHTRELVRMVAYVR
jgi:hypothetical protein